MNRVLVVEDEKMIRKGIVTMLGRYDTPIGEITECRNGLEALEALNKQEYDLCFTDIRMPKMDGLTLVAKINEMDLKMKVVVISGYDEFNYAVEALRQGVSDYILKPIERDKLGEILARIEEEIKQEAWDNAVANQPPGHWRQVQVRESFFANEEVMMTEEEATCQMNLKYDESLINEYLCREEEAKMIRLFGTANTRAFYDKIDWLMNLAQKDQLPKASVIAYVEDLFVQLNQTYNRITQLSGDAYYKLCSPLKFQSQEAYLKALDSWLSEIAKVLETEFEDYKNMEKIKAGIEYIHEHFNEDINMAVVSNEISMNYSLFSLKFKAYTGMKFVDYKKKLRMEAACSMLEETEDKIISISQKVGFDNEKHFMKQFKEIYGVTPGDYRKNKWLEKHS